MMETSTSCWRSITTTSALSPDSLVSVIRSSRIVFQSRDKYCDECREKNRFKGGFEFKCVLGSCIKDCFESGFEYVFDCIYTKSENAVPGL